jgi:xylan 1,4-beta-xylosidase
MEKIMNNPIVPGFHADPSILRVGDTYYLANSTFEWYPGVEVHCSKDLVNWKPLPSPLSESRLLDMKGNGASCGIWAPCLSYSDGLFYLRPSTPYMFTGILLQEYSPKKSGSLVHPAVSTPARQYN